MSKIRTDLAMKEIKLNTPVMIKNLQSLLEKSTLLYPESRWAPVGAYIERSPCGVADVLESRDGPDSPC